MEYDFIVSPGADYSQIKIQYEGTESISINDNGQLVVETKWGEVVEQRPIVYQIENNSRITVVGEYKIHDDNSFGFELSSYNPDLPLVIDPILSYSTYLGGSGHDIGAGIAVDISGAVYVTGWTVSNDFPTLNPYQGTKQGGFDSFDAFVTKLSSSGATLVYSTYLGGSSLDQAYSIAVDASGAAYVTGYTNSTDFPIEGEYQTDQGNSDAFVTKFMEPIICCDLPGDADDGGDVNIADAAGGGDVNIGDATFIVKFIFQDGDPPDCPSPGGLVCP